MANAAKILTPNLRVAHKSRVNIPLVKFLTNLNFDKNRLVITEDIELTDEYLTVYLEDKEDFKDNVDDLFKLEIPIEDFKQIISANELNSYTGTLFTERGRAYDGRIEIAEPVKWFEEDASTFERGVALDLVKSAILKSTLS